MSGRSLTEKGRSKQILKRAKPCHHHKGKGEIDGGKTKRSRVWYEGPPLLPAKAGGGEVSTVYQTNGKD